MSDQTDEDEADRLLMANLESKASYLFVKEPYKWENLFQSITRELVQGDYDSIRAMHILLSTISLSEKEKILQIFEVEDIFDSYILEQLKGFSSISSYTKKNPLRFLRILFVIFTNPYGIAIKRKKNHIYEKTGSFLYNLKKIIRL